MIFRKIDSGGDWTFGRGIAGYTTAEDAIQLNIKTRILSWVGNCFFALQDFVDWSSRLDVGQQDALVEDLKSVILNAFGVVGINSVQVVFDSSRRNILINYDIQTIYSPSFATTILQAAGFGG